MIRIPAYRSCYMQCDLREEAKQWRDLIRYHFCRMIVSVIHQRQAFILMLCCKGQCKLCTSCCIGFHTDTKYFGLYAWFYHIEIVWLGKDFLDGFFITHSRSKAVSRNVLISVTCPDVHNTWDTCFFSKILGNTDTCLTVADPEFSGFFIRTA